MRTDAQIKFLYYLLVILFFLPRAYGFLLSTVSLVDSHLLVLVLNLLLIAILLYFGKLLQIFVVHCLSSLHFVFSFLSAFPFFLFCFSQLHHFVNFLVIFKISILGYPFLLAIYLFLFCFDNFVFPYLFYFFYFLRCCHFHLSFCFYLYLFLWICFDISQHAIMSHY